MLAGTQWNEKKLLEIKKNIVQKSGKCVTQDFNFFGVFFFLNATVVTDMVISKKMCRG